MAIAIDASEGTASSQDLLCGASRAHAIDRWIYVVTALGLIAVVLAGFVPDSVSKLAAIRAGERPPFPLVLHIHAVLMASFLVMLLGQTVLMATGRRAGHMQLGIAALILTPAIVITGFVLAPTMYHQVWNAAQHAPSPARERFQAVLPVVEDILLLQIRAGVLFTIYMWIALRARAGDPGLHKRMIILAVTAVLGAAIDRIGWLPATMPASPLSMDIYSMLAVAPMLAWDLIRNRSLHRAYLLWAAFFIPVSAFVYAAWDKPWWHAIAPRIMGV